MRAPGSTPRSYRRGPRCLRAIALATSALAVFVASWGMPTESSRTLAAEESAAAVQEGTIRVKVIAGRLIARCDISTPSRRLPVNLLVELDNPCGLALHNNAAGRDGLDADRTGAPITIHFPGFKIDGGAREKGDERLYGELTKDHAVALGETAVTGTLGARILARYHVVFDLEGGVIELRRPKAADEAAKAPTEEAITTPVSLHGGLVWMPVALRDGVAGALALGSSHPSSRIERSVARQLDAPSGAVGPVRVADQDLAAQIAFRAGTVAESHPDGVVGVTGLSLLERYRVEIDRVNQVVRLWEQGASTRDDDRAFFDALAAVGPQGLGAYLEAWPEGRHRGAAAEALVDRNLEMGVEDATAWAQALDAFVETRAEERRATSMLELMESLYEWDVLDAAVAAGERGIEHGREDKDPNAVHQIHARLGVWFLEQDDTTRSWKHLLSAAFGLPEDGRVNLDLGRLYERRGRYARAFSRYVQALIAPDSGPAALEALARVQPKLGESDRFDVELVERAIAGKGHDFTAPDTYRPKPSAAEAEAPPGAHRRVVLAELFTNATPRGMVAADLGFHGVLTHFPAEHVACVMHHIPVPGMEPLITRASMARAEATQGQPSVLLVDGKQAGSGGGKPREAQKRYRLYKQAILDGLAKPSAYQLTGSARIEDGALRGELRLEGPYERGLRVHTWLIEKGVVFPGSSRVVIHRHVLRAALPPTGTRFAPEGDAEHAVIPFEASLDQVQADIDRFLAAQSWRGSMVSWNTHIDAAQVAVIAFVESTQTGGVLQAIHIDPVRAEEELGVADPAATPREGRDE